MARLRLSLIALCLLGLLFATSGAYAQLSPAPSIINFQGRLTKPDGTPVPNGTYSIRFSIWDSATGGTEKWNQTINSVTVRNGTLAVLLSLNAGFTGSNDLRSTLNSDMYLEIKVGANAALTPRQRIISVVNALRANSVPDGSIDSDQLADNAVTSAKIADGAIAAADLAPNALTNIAWLLGGNNITNSTTQFFGTTSNQGLAFRTNNTEKMRLLANGALGIGTNAPLQTLDVNGRIHVANGVIQRGGAAITTTADLGLYSLVAGNWLRIVANAAPMHFFTNSVAGASANPAANSAAMTLSAEGFLGLGTMSPNAPFHINTGVQTPARIVGSNTVGTWLSLENAGGGTAWNFISTGSNNGEGASHLVFHNAINGNVAQISPNGEFKTRVVIITGGSDVAEPYHIAPAGEVKPLPGHVVAIHPDKIGQLRVADSAYDTTVAGIVSGAGGVHPGITLTQKGTIADGELPVASIGRVWALCDADKGEIKAGDLLTSSDTPGHAMKAADKERRDGAVIGKAMSSLKSGKGLVLVLVSLK